MPQNQTRRAPRRLVLSRETVRALTERAAVTDTIPGPGDDTSCGEACTCACDTQTQ